MKQEPNWQSIHNLPLIINMIDGQLAEAIEQHENLLEAQNKPHVLDDYIVQRIIQVYTEQLEFVPIYKKQLEKWQEETLLTAEQQSEIKRLQKQVEQWKQVVTDILDLASKLNMFRA